MNITNEKTNGEIQELRIEISREDYTPNVETALKKQRKTAQIPGFRIGNAPMGLIRKQYEKAIIADEVNELLNKAIYGHIQDNKLDILFEPLPVEEKSQVDFENPDNFVFTYEIALQPAINVDFKSLPHVSSFKIVASKEEKDNIINQMRRRFGNYINPETIGEDDYITVKIEDKEYYFFGKDLNDEGRKNLVGKKVNDNCHLAFRKIFADEKTVLRVLKMTEKELEEGNNYEFDCTIASIGRMELAEVNDDFFKKAYPDGSVTSVEQMEANAAQQVENQWKQYTDRQFMSDAIGVLIDNVNITLPDEFVKRYLLASQKDLTAEKLDEQYGEYTKSIKWQLLENKIAKENNIHVSQDDIKEFVRNFFMTNYFNNFNGEDVKERVESLVEDTLKRKEDVKNIYDQLYDSKLQEALRKCLNVDEKSGSYDDFMKQISEGKDTKKKPAAKTTKAKKESKADETTEVTEAKPKAKTTKAKAKKEE